MERAPHAGPSPEQAEDSELDGEHQYEILKSPDLRVEYLNLTDTLIARMAEQKTDVAIFLDKSARPVEWFVNTFWDVLAPRDEQTDEPVRKPAFKFLNIDREQWGPLIGRSEDKNGSIDVSRIPTGQIEALHKIYAKNQDSEETFLSGKNVMVVDEFRQSGDTLHMASEILKRAFPDTAKIDEAYWMPGKVELDVRSGAKVGKDGPVWYSDETNMGRMIADRDSLKSSRSPHWRIRAGEYWLSTPFKNTDVAGKQLYREVKNMLGDLLNHRIIYKPAATWSIDEAESRILRLNGITIEEYKMLRQAAHNDEELNFLYRGYLENRLTSGLRSSILPRRPI